VNTVLLAVGDVHRDFKAEAHFGEFGLGPHGIAPYEFVVVSKLQLRTIENTQPTRCILRTSAAASQRNTLNVAS
jgi:hypothetical protein